MSFVVFLYLLIGLVLLVLGAEAFVRGAAKMAALIGLSPLVIGLTVVSYGTSAPELAVSLRASYLGQADIALGNVVGSNIFNILMILGLASLIVPLTVAQQLIRLDVPIMIGVTGLMLMFSLDGELGHVDGLILLVGSIVYTAFLVLQSRHEKDENVQAEYAQEYAQSKRPSWQQGMRFAAFLLGGLALLVGGANLLVYGATEIAEAMGISQLIIGLTIVAIGTSLPELATSLVACYRGERDIAVGNVIGSNIFNVLTILGVTATFSGVPVSSAAISFDIPVMLAVAIACLPIFYTGNRISRWEGLLFISYYVAYSAYLGLNAIGHDQLGFFSRVMLLFVIPLTVITLLTILFRRPQGLTHRATKPPNQPQCPPFDPVPLSTPSPDQPSPSRSKGQIEPEADSEHLS